MSEKPDRLLRRPPRTIPTILLALLLGATGGLGIWILGHRLLHGTWPPDVADTLTTLASTRADDVGVIALAVALLVLGLAFVACALLPGDLTRRALLTDDTPGRTVVSRRDLAKSVRNRVSRVDGVGTVKVSLRRSKLDVAVRTPVDDTETVLRRSRAAVEAVIDDLRPEKTVTPRVKVTPQR